MSLVRASGTLTKTGALANAETVTIGGKVYTLQSALTNVDGNVKVGASDTETLANLKAAINLDAGAGTAYAAAMTANPHVRAVSSDATTLVVKARVGGAIGNYIPTTETCANAAWGGTTLAGGSGDLAAELRLARDRTPAQRDGRAVAGRHHGPRGRRVTLD